RTPAPPSDPAVEAINFEPQPNPDTLPPNTDTVIGPDDFVSLEAIAYDVNGDQLYCHWEVTPLSGTGPGIFSFPGNSGRMSWDPTYVRADGGQGAWRSVWQWRPPPGVSGAERFELQCKVAQEGAPPVLAEIKRIQTLPPGNILFETDRAAGFQTYEMYQDGSQQRPLVHDQPESAQPTANINGSRIVFMCQDDLYLLRRPLQVAERLTATPEREHLPAITPTGNLVAFRRDDRVIVKEAVAGGREVVVDTVTWLSGCAVDPPGIDRICWNPAGTELLYTNGNTVVRASIATGPGGPSVVGGPTAFLSAPNPVSAPFWSQDGARVYYVRNDGDPYIWWCDGAGGGDTQLTSSVGTADHQPCRSPFNGDLLLVRHPVGVLDVQIYHSSDAVNWVQLTAGGTNCFPVWTR
ncbi:MAG: hypothetical protein AB1758_26465, partial [Candidatus Eremiobacterota bacterium]